MALFPNWNTDIISRGFRFIEKRELGTVKKDIAEIERMLKALIKSLENKPLNPWPLESLDPLLQLNWRRTKINNYRLIYITNIANRSHPIGECIYAKKCHHLKPFGIAEFTEYAALWYICSSRRRFIPLNSAGLYVSCHRYGRMEYCESGRK